MRLTCSLIPRTGLGMTLISLEIQYTVTLDHLLMCTKAMLVNFKWLILWDISEFVLLSSLCLHFQKWRSCLPKNQPGRRITCRCRRLSLLQIWSEVMAQTTRYMYEFLNVFYYFSKWRKTQNMTECLSPNTCNIIKPLICHRSIFTMQARMHHWWLKG